MSTPAAKLLMRLAHVAEVWRDADAGSREEADAERYVIEAARALLQHVAPVEVTDADVDGALVAWSCSHPGDGPDVRMLMALECFAGRLRARGATP